MTDRQATSGAGAIEARDLVKKFGPVTAVVGVSFTARAGEFFGFLGPNGAGKTTTIHMLCTLIQPTTGSARVNGYDVVREAIEVRRTIGLVFQETTLDKDLTVSENLFFTCYLHGMKKKDAARRVDEILNTLRLAEYRDTLVKRLSGGLRRRVDIARGVLHDARILFLDEPTAGLDPQARADLWTFLETLRREKGITLFLTTHYLEEAERCDRIGIMHQAKLIALGSPAELTGASPAGAARPTLNDVFLRLTGSGIPEPR
jgi:ABC-2 type transport system ATP-binding protein